MARPPDGPFAGVPILIKDLVVEKGVPVTFGSVFFRDYLRRHYLGIPAQNRPGRLHRHWSNKHARVRTSANYRANPPWPDPESVEPQPIRRWFERWRRRGRSRRHRAACAGE